VKVHIVGGGIGGLTTAIGIAHRSGLEPIVHEAAAELRPVGTGIVLGANALTALERLDLTENIRDVGAEIEVLQILAPDGRSLRNIDLTATRVGVPYVYLPRPTLQQLLIDRLPGNVIHLNQLCVEVAPASRSPEEPTIHFEGEREVTGSVVIGADGIDSVVRKAVVDQEYRRETGTVTYRGIAPFDASLDGETRQIWGSGTRVGVAPLGDGRTYWFATANESVGDRPILSALRDRYRHYPAPIPAALDRTEPSELVVSRLADVAPLPRWHLGCIALLGDAAHAPLPYLGQGAGQAIEDGVALSDRLAMRTPSQAIESYESVRKRRADRVTRLSRYMWRLAQLEGLFAKTRNMFVSQGPAMIAHWQQRWLANARL